MLYNVSIVSSRLEPKDHIIAEQQHKRVVHETPHWQGFAKGYVLRASQTFFPQ